MKLPPMLRQRKWWLVGAPVVIIAVAAAFLLSRAKTKDEDVLKVAYSMNGGGYGLASSGTPEAIRHEGIEILRKSTDGTQCCGFTFWVAMKVAEQRGLLNGKEAYELKRFQSEWFGASKHSAEKECALAIATLGIGKEIAPADARAGDFATFQRYPRGAGHSVIFLDWIRYNKIIVGVKYRSSQPNTQGVGDRMEYFTSSGYKNATINPKRFYVARLKS